MATSRAPCQSCSLPFYTDVNDLCPYCGQVVADGGVADAPVVRSRASCDTCGLAYYDDEGECPYCAAAAERAGSIETEAVETEPDEGEPASDTDAVAGTTTTAPARPRVTCDTCGLAYYGDENDACPYCAQTTPATATASEEETSEASAGEPDPAAGGTETGSASGDQGSSSLLGSLLRPLRKLFGG